MSIINEQKELHWAGKRVSCYSLGMLGVALSGVFVIAADEQSGREFDPVIAYVPHDPEHPLKVYASGADFTNELIRQLRENVRPGAEATLVRVTLEGAQPARAESYQHFFTQFVAHKERGRFSGEAQ